MATYGVNSTVFYVFISFRPKGQNLTSFPAVSLGQSPFSSRGVRAEPDTKTKPCRQSSARVQPVESALGNS